MTYSEKLKDPRWQKKRLKILERDAFACKMCCDDTSELHVHHILYKQKTAPWDYSDEELVTLCYRCHGNIKELQVDVGELAAYDPSAYSCFRIICRLIATQNAFDLELFLEFLERYPEKIEAFAKTLTERAK